MLALKAGSCHSVGSRPLRPDQLDDLFNFVGASRRVTLAAFGYYASAGDWRGLFAPTLGVFSYTRSLQGPQRGLVKFSSLC